MYAKLKLPSILTNKFVSTVNCCFDLSFVVATGHNMQHTEHSKQRLLDLYKHLDNTSPHTWLGNHKQSQVLFVEPELMEELELEEVAGP